MSNKIITHIIPKWPDRGYYYFPEVPPFSLAINFYGAFIVEDKIDWKTSDIKEHHAETVNNQNFQRDKKNSVYTETDTSNFKQSVQVIKSLNFLNKSRKLINYWFQRLNNEDVFFDNWTNQEESRYFYWFEFLKLNRHYKEFCELLRKSKDNDAYSSAFDIQMGPPIINLAPNDGDWSKINKVKIFTEEFEVMQNQKELKVSCPYDWECDGKKKSLVINISGPFKGSYHCSNCSLEGDLKKDDFYIKKTLEPYKTYEYLDDNNKSKYSEEKVYTADLAYTYLLFGDVFIEEFEGEKGFYNWWVKPITCISDETSRIHKQWADIIYRMDKEDSENKMQICRGAYLFAHWGQANNLRLQRKIEIIGDAEQGDMVSNFYVRIDLNLTNEEINIQLDKLKEDIKEKSKKEKSNYKKTREPLLKLRKQRGQSCKNLKKNLKAYDLHLKNKKSVEIGYQFDKELEFRGKIKKDMRADQIKNDCPELRPRFRKHGRELVMTAKKNIIASIVKNERNMRQTNELLINESQFPAAK